MKLTARQVKALLKRYAPGGIGYAVPIVGELIEARRRCSKTLLHANGARTMIATGRPMHKQDAAGNWVELGELEAATDYAGETADGDITGSDITYSTARSTSTTSTTTATTAYCGQIPGGVKYVSRGYISIDTSGIDDDATVVAATLYVRGDADGSTVDFLVKVYRFGWAEPLDNITRREANYDGAYGGTATLEGTLRDTADGWVSGTWYSLALATAGISKTGDSKYVLVSQEDVDNSEPVSDEYVKWRTANYAGSVPYITITTGVAAEVLAVAATAAAAGPAPVGTGKSLRRVAVATALAGGAAPAPGGSAELLAAVATAVAEALGTAFASVNLIVVAATATAAAATPVVGGSATVTASTTASATATGQAPAPTGSANVAAAIAAALAAAQGPGLELPANVLAAVAAAIAAALPPDVAILIVAMCTATDSVASDITASDALICTCVVSDAGLCSVAVSDAPGG